MVHVRIAYHEVELRERAKRLGIEERIVEGDAGKTIHYQIYAGVWRYL